jgi:DNA-binding LytR/AlgR family response regulator
VKITIEHVPCGENEVILKCSELDAEMLEILSFLRKSMPKIAAKKDGSLVLLSSNEIFYVDSVDSRSFLYTKEDVLESNETLTSLEEKFSDAGLVRIGKSQLVNLHHVRRLKSILYSRIEITLESGDKLIVSRHYAQAFKHRLGVE